MVIIHDNDKKKYQQFYDELVTEPFQVCPSCNQLGIRFYWGGVQSNDLVLTFTCDQCGWAEDRMIDTDSLMKMILRLNPETKRISWQIKCYCILTESPNCFRAKTDRLIFGEWNNEFSKQLLKLRNKFLLRFTRKIRNMLKFVRLR